MGPIHWTILSSVLFAAAVQSLAFPGPNPTFEVVVPLNAQSPRTTDPPAVPEILRRQNGLNSTQTVIYATDNTCGFMSGRLGAALSCYSTRSCFFFPSLGLRGCCDGDDCGFAVACRDMEEASISKYCDNGCLMDTLTVKCTDTSYPYCNTALYLGGITDYFCNSLNVSSPQIVETTYRGQTDRTLITTVVDLATLTTTTTKPPIILSESDTTSSSSSPSPPSSLSKPAPPSQSPSPTSVPQESSTPIAPIVGGVVGGVAVIGLIVLGIIFLVKKGGSKPPPPAPTPGPTDPSSPIGFSATPMGGSPLPQQVQQQQTPPPADVKYGQSEPMVQAYPAVVPPTQGYQQQPQQYQQKQQQYSPQGSTGVGYFVSSVPSQQQYQQPSPTDPNNRLSTASPASPTSNSDSPQEQRHFSQQSFASNSTYPNIQAYQQQGAGAAQGNTGYQYAPPQPPPNVYEAGGHVVGGPPDLNADHRGQIYQLQ